MEAFTPGPQVFFTLASIKPLLFSKGLHNILQCHVLLVHYNPLDMEQPLQGSHYPHLTSLLCKLWNDLQDRSQQVQCGSQVAVIY